MSVYSTPERMHRHSMSDAEKPTNWSDTSMVSVSCTRIVRFSSNLAESTSHGRRPSSFRHCEAAGSLFVTCASRRAWPLEAAYFVVHVHFGVLQQK